MYLNNINKEIPSCILNDRNLIKKIEDILSYDQTVTTFCEVDDLDQDMMIALGLEALNHDIELFVDVPKLARYLKSYSRDTEIDLTASIRDQAKEYFTPIFDQMIDCHHQYNSNLNPYNDHSGEINMDYYRGLLPC